MMIPKNKFTLPSLKRYDITEGEFSLGNISQIEISEQISELTEFFVDFFKISQSDIKLNINKNISLIARQPSRCPKAPQHKQGYSILIESDGLAITAADVDGMFYAVKTLEQLTDGSGIIKCGEVSDWPDVTLRGWHLDCKGGFPDDLKKLYKMIDQLAALKFNALLIEYEDRFPYQFAPELINSDGAPSLEEWAEFLNYCRKRRFQIIPLVQALGHMEFVLKHPRFYPLRENGQFNELCPSNPDAVDVIKTMLEEVCKLHEKDKFFHIGCDETWALGSCPCCQKHKKSKLNILLDHVCDLHKFLTERGKKTLIWTDMFWRCGTPEMAELLPKDIILCEWNYEGEVTGGNFFNYKGQNWVSKQRRMSAPTTIPETYNDYDSEPQIKDFAQQYFAPDSEQGIGAISPYVSFFKNLGFNVIGTAAERCYRSEGSTFGQDMISRFNNITSWSKLASSVEFDGIILSSWSRSSHFSPLYSPREITADARAMAAQYFWNCQCHDDSIFNHISHDVYGCNDAKSELADFYKGLSALEDGKAPGIKKYLLEKLTSLEKKATCNQQQLQLFKLWVEFESFRTQATACANKMEFFIYSAQNGVVENDIYNISQIVLDIKNTQIELQNWEKCLEKELCAFFSPGDLKDFVQSRIINLKFRFNSLETFYKNN